jgi:hypothetical protein
VYRDAREANYFGTSTSISALDGLNAARANASLLGRGVPSGKDMTVASPLDGLPPDTLMIPRAAATVAEHFGDLQSAYMHHRQQGHDHGPSCDAAMNAVLSRDDYESVTAFMVGPAGSPGDTLRTITSRQLLATYRKAIAMGLLPDVPSRATSTRPKPESVTPSQTSGASVVSSVREGRLAPAPRESRLQPPPPSEPRLAPHRRDA